MQKRESYIYVSEKSVQPMCNLNECKPAGILFPIEIEALEKLKRYLEQNSITVWCSNSGFQSLMDRFILTGNVDNYIGRIADFVKECPLKPTEIYCLMDNGELTTKTIQ